MWNMTASNNRINRQPNRQHHSPHHHRELMHNIFLKRLGILIAVVTLTAACTTTAKQTSVKVDQPVSVPHTNLKTDETVLLFPTNARFDTQTKQWQVHVHGWVFEPERDSAWRNGTIGALKLALDVKKDTPEAKVFEDAAITGNEDVRRTSRQWAAAPSGDVPSSATPRGEPRAAG